MKSWQIIIAVIVVLLGAYFFLLSKSSNTSNISPSSTSPDTMTYFWSETCPHCKNVANFLSTWPNADKLKLDKKEVSKNQANGLLLSQKAAQCGLPSDQVGVPFLVTLDNKCITGDEPVIEYFKSLFPESSPSATPT